MKTALKIFYLLSVVSLFSCEPNEKIDESAEKEIETVEWLSSDTIVIQTVSPSTELQDGETYTFTVEAKYNVASMDSAMIMLGFNNKSLHSFNMVSSASIIIKKGSGQHTFMVDGLAKDWGDQGDFQVLLNISEYPHPPSWIPIAFDLMTLEVLN